MEVGGEPGDYAGNQFSPPAQNLHRPGGVQQVEPRVHAALRQPLHAQVAVVGDVADDVAGLVDVGHQQAPGLTCPQRHQHRAQVIDLHLDADPARVHLPQPLRQPLADLVFVAAHTRQLGQQCEGVTGLGILCRHRHGQHDGIKAGFNCDGADNRQESRCRRDVTRQLR